MKDSTLKKANELTTKIKLVENDISVVEDALEFQLNSKEKGQQIELPILNNSAKKKHKTIVGTIVNFVQIGIKREDLILFLDVRIATHKRVLAKLYNELEAL